MYPGVEEITSQEDVEMRDAQEDVEMRDEGSWTSRMLQAETSGFLCRVRYSHNVLPSEALLIFRSCHTARPFLLRTEMEACAKDNLIISTDRFGIPEGSIPLDQYRPEAALSVLPLCCSASAR